MDLGLLHQTISMGGYERRMLAGVGYVPVFLPRRWALRLFGNNRDSHPFGLVNIDSLARVMVEKRGAYLGH